MPFESEVVVLKEAIAGCRAQRCPNVSSQLPAELAFLRVPLCEDHIRYLLLHVDGLQGEGLTGKEDLERALRFEAQALIFPVAGVPRLIVLEGGVE